MTSALTTRSVMISVPGNPVMTANQSRAWTWQKQKRHTAAMRSQVAWIARQAKVPALGPSEVSVTWFCDNRRHDVDSVTAFAKAACDGLVDAGVWPDDNPRHVVAVHLYHGYDKVEPRVEICLTPAAEVAA